MAQSTGLCNKLKMTSLSNLFPALHQFGILGHPVEDGVRLLEEFVGGVELLDESLVQHHNLVIVKDGVQP